ncbi:hypothetical protein [Shouchella clausii]|uniref:hypothetical protein n=1 Tax=Shouchella clausii TaxID=79880 RepID=UPI00226D3CB4|nr:hypothetical protein [Shouchella clausii]MCY1105817.1 hypothetical protein [Shouchella clausii]
MKKFLKGIAVVGVLTVGIAVGTGDSTNIAGPGNVPHNESYLGGPGNVPHPTN